MPPSEPEKSLAAFHAALRALPDRAAPAALEERVRAVIALRAARPWWRRSFADWPRDGRTVLLIFLTGAAAGLFALLQSDAAGEAAGALARRIPWLALAQSIGASLVNSVRVLGEALPRGWLYLAVAVLALCYCILFGLGAAAYRAFFRSRHPLRPLSS